MHTTYININTKIVLDPNKELAINLAGSEDLIQEVEFNIINFNIYKQNYKHYKIINNEAIRFDSSECVELKNKYIGRIRKYRSQALKLYDTYEVKVMRGKQIEDPLAEEWYQWVLDFPETYDNNISYHEQIRLTPESISKYR